MRSVMVVMLLLTMIPQSHAQEAPPAALDEGLAQLEVLSAEEHWDEFGQLSAALVESYPEDGRAWVKRGNWLWHEERLEEARTAYERAIALDPGLLEAHLQLARMARDVGGYDIYAAAVRDVVDLCLRAIETDPDSRDAWHVLGIAFEALGDKANADAVFERVLELNPDDSEALMREAFARYQSGERQEAEDLARRAVELSPRNVRARRTLGLLLLLNDRPREALEVLEAIREVNAAAYPHGLAGDIYRAGLNDTDTALREYEAAIEADPTDASGYERKCDQLCADQNDPEGALAVLQQAEAAGVPKRDLQIWFGLTYAALQRWEDALSAWTAEIDYWPPDFYSRYRRATVFYELGRYAEAWQDVRKSEELGAERGWTVPEEFLTKLREAMPEPPAEDAQGEPPATLEKGLAQLEVLSDEERWDELGDLSAALVESYPEDGRVWAKRGNWLAREKRFEESRIAYERAIALNPGLLDAHLRLAYLTREPRGPDGFTGAVRAVIDLCLTAIEADPNDRDAWFVMAEAFQTLDDPAVARANIQQLLSIYPDDTEALAWESGCLFQAGELQAAEDLARRAVEANPHSVHSRRLLGVWLVRNGHPHEALEVLDSIGEVNPGAYPHTMIGDVYRGLNDRDAALGEFDAAIEADPTGASGYVSKSKLFNEVDGNPEAALAVLQQAEAAGVPSRDLQMAYAFIYQAQERWEDALAAWNAEIDSGPDYFFSRYQRAKVLYELGRYAEAWRDVRRSEELRASPGWTVPEDFLTKLREAMPEPPIEETQDEN